MEDKDKIKRMQNIIDTQRELILILKDSVNSLTDSLLSKGSYSSPTTSFISHDMILSDGEDPING